ncbi:hypothetical protein BGX34_006472 [Mortierella sp. NVP85]|nr:hypothetical protein BGX34_006472 [Mortierella sp. NVP85]
MPRQSSPDRTILSAGWRCPKSGSTIAQDNVNHIHELKDVEAERMSTVEPHRPVSMKRRKVSDGDDDDENDSYDGEDFEPRSRDTDSDGTSSPFHRSSNIAEFAPAETPSATRSSQRISSCPSRKRRSILAEPSSRFAAPSQKALSVNNSSNVDTSSLSLLSSTSAIVSEGGLPVLDSDSGSNQSIFSPPSSSSPSSSSSASSSSASSPTEPRSSLFLDSTSCDFISANAVKKQTASASSFCRRLRYNFPLLGACRKRSFEDAIELTRPLGNDPSVEYQGWLGSIKRRKIHHFPTRWTSALSPSPYVKLMAMRDFWDVMRSRLDLSWLDLLAITASQLQEFNQDEMPDQTDKVNHSDSSAGPINESTNSTPECMGTESSIAKATFSPKLPSRILSLRESDSTSDLCEDNVYGKEWSMGSRSRRKTVVQHPNPSLSLRGLWEEEERNRRQRQMIPDSVHRPTRSKILNRKPIPRSKVVRTQSTSWIKPWTESDMASSASSSSFPETKEEALEDSNTSSSTEAVASNEASPQNQGEQELLLKKKPGPTATIRSHALSEGYDLNEYKPWRDGTITPHRGCIRSLCEMRNTMLDPWPKEESRAKDECTRILHRMREQLNVVINLQIHLRSMIKTTPSHMSFLLSIRHPGQVSVELLSALYGPQFIQTSAFKAIEQLLWGGNQTQRIGYYQNHDNRSQQQQQHQQHHALEYQYHDDDDDHEQDSSFEDEDDSTCIQNHQQHFHTSDYQDHLRQQRYHYHDHEHHIMEEDGECKFVDEFGDQSYQDPILEMGRMLDESHQRELMAFGSETKIESHDEELQEFSGAKTADTAASQVFRDT